MEAKSIKRHSTIVKGIFEESHFGASASLRKLKWRIQKGSPMNLKGG